MSSLNLTGTLPGGGTIECGTARIVAGSAEVVTNLGTVTFGHFTYTEDASALTANAIGSTLTITNDTGNYITVLDSNSNALSADFCYMLTGY